MATAGAGTGKSTAAKDTSNSSGASKRFRFIFVHGDKGGVGKSVTAQAIADFLHEQGEKVAIIDADTQNPDVERMFNSKLPSIRISLRNEDGWMDVINFMMKNPGHNVVMNTPAGIGENIKTEIPMLAAFLAKEDVNMDLELWWVMNLRHDSVNLLDRAISEYGKYFARTRVVCNMHFGEQHKFILWNESPMRAKLENSGGMTIYLPAIHVRVTNKLFDPQKIMPFSEAFDLVTGESIGFEHSERFKLEYWYREMSECMAPAFGYKIELSATK